MRKIINKTKDLQQNFKVSVEQMKSEETMGDCQQEGLNSGKFTRRILQSKFKYRTGLIFSLSTFPLK